MMTLKKEKIPKYLHKSNFYENLNDEEIVDVPVGFYKKDDTINNFDDFIQLFNIFKFFICKFSSSFKKFYILQSKQILEYFSGMYFELEVQDMLTQFSLLKIKNPNQFISTYKIMNIYNLKNNLLSEYYNKNKLKIIDKCNILSEQDILNDLKHKIIITPFIKNGVFNIRYLELCVDLDNLSYSHYIYYRKTEEEINNLNTFKSHILNMQNTSFKYHFLVYKNKILTLINSELQIKVNIFNRNEICEDIDKIIKLISN